MTELCDPVLSLVYLFLEGTQVSPIPVVLLFHVRFQVAEVSRGPIINSNIQVSDVGSFKYKL